MQAASLTSFAECMRDVHSAEQGKGRHEPCGRTRKDRCGGNEAGGPQVDQAAIPDEALEEHASHECPSRCRDEECSRAGEQRQQYRFGEHLRNEA